MFKWFGDWLKVRNFGFRFDAYANLEKNLTDYGTMESLI